MRIERDGGLDHSQFEPQQWQEAEAPPPPDFDIRRLVPLEMPRYMSLRFGVDPKTMSVTGDGVVRYVVVAHREGGDTVNAFYEGVRCATDEYKTYARYSGNRWETVPTAEWKRIDDRNSIYTHQLAKQSLCSGGRAPRSTVADMIRELKRPEIQSN
ncbi:MAG: hypothetical protein EOO29_02430 [Comamonadaceae bacterium]|nr:MAG: hypothetical protein EOO29_02430 [Comamonadaceae bacterium]